MGVALDRPREIAPDRDALFLDFDGTLVEIAPTPIPCGPAGLPSLLTVLRRRLGGALAVVTGRPVEAVDGFLGLGGLTVAGLHGRDRRLADGRAAQAGRCGQRRCGPDEAHRPGRPPPRDADRGQGEASRCIFARHQAEAAEVEARAIEAESQGELRLLPGKMVVELVPAGFDKGRPWHG